MCMYIVILFGLSLFVHQILFSMAAQARSGEVICMYIVILFGLSLFVQQVLFSAASDKGGFHGVSQYGRSFPFYYQ